MAGITVTTWPQPDGSDRIDLFWRDSNVGFSHVGGDGKDWSGNRIGYDSVVPNLSDALGGIFTTVPAAVWTLDRLTPIVVDPTPQPIHHVPLPIPPVPPLAAAAGHPTAPGAGVAAAVAAPAAHAAPLVPATAAADVPAAHAAVHPPPLPVAEAHRIDVFGLGLDFAMYRQWVWNGLPGNPQPLTTWERLGGDFISAPAALAWNDGQDSNRIDVFAVSAADRSMWQRTWKGNAWAGDWQSIGGIFTSAATVVSWGPGRFDIFARGGDFTLRHRAYENGAWVSDWENLGGSLASQPVAVSRGPNQVDVVSVDHADGALTHRWWDGSIWSEWESASVPDKPKVGFVTTPSVTASGADRLDVATIGNDGVLYHFWWQAGAFHNPLALGNEIQTSPTITRLPSGALLLLGGGGNDSLRQLSFDGTHWSSPNALKTGYGAAIEATFSLPSRYGFSMDNVRADTARSPEQDTDVGTVTITAGNWPSVSKTEIFQQDILDGSNYQPQELAFSDVEVDLCEHVIVAYQISNKANARDIDIVDEKFSFENVASVIAADALKSISKQLDSGAHFISAVEIASLGVPVMGSILGIIAGWLTGELGDILKSGRCDGLVAVEQRVILGRDLFASTLNGLYKVTTPHPGKESPFGCGSTSQYTVDWSTSKA
jgi:hypothetical protein